MVLKVVQWVCIVVFELCIRYIACDRTSIGGNGKSCKGGNLEFGYVAV